jgi:hypothetical protein
VSRYYRYLLGKCRLTRDEQKIEEFDSDPNAQIR